ncbi:MAG: diacylglycerol kinase [Desulfobulbaceae bacterium]|nr:diacylglycerol kinase [Desulfobulbaceae bacterium]
MKKHQAKGVNRLIKALSWSLSGLKTAFLDETAFRQEVILFFLLGPLGYWLGENPAEKCLLVGSLLLVLLVELLNSSIEAAVDRISEEQHPLAGKAKDMGSAAVFLALMNVVIVWVIILTS